MPIVRGWKAISSHLGRSESWCKRWVKSAAEPPLPVFFVQGRVEAFRFELDRWGVELATWARRHPKRRSGRRGH